jgi:hypothetical protein
VRPGLSAPRSSPTAPGGTLVKPTKITLAEAIDNWLAGRRNLRPTTLRSYTDCLRTAKEQLGHVPLQNLTKAHLDGLVTYLQESGRRVGNVQRKGLGPRCINVTLTLLGSVQEDAVRQGTLSRNVAKIVERPSQARHEMQTWTAEQAATFLEAVASDRLGATFMLSLYGLRRGEVLGLRWSDVDLDAKTITIRITRVLVVGSGVVEGEPKTERGRRTLPLDDGLAVALRSLRARQARDRLAAGKAYTAACEDCRGEHLVVDELGKPYRPEWYGGPVRSTGQGGRATGHPAPRCPAHLRDADAPPGSPHGRQLEMARARHGQLHDGDLCALSGRRTHSGRADAGLSVYFCPEGQVRVRNSHDHLLT